jgi:hypothetical protein
MAEVNFQLRGWHALLAIPLLLGYLGFKMWLRVLPVDEAVNNAVREELLKEYPSSTSSPWSSRTSNLLP